MKIIQYLEQSDREFIRKKVIEHNMEQIPDRLKTSVKTVGFILKDEQQETVGGITGTMFWRHLHIDFLWVDKTIRGKGYGSKLLNKMEHFARENKCRFIDLDTFSFQAPEFYKKHGFQVFGMLEDHPEGFNHYFLQKRYSK
ncbi:GNAT family N-acetyltransferase [Sporolactobacillus shoreicorticis]|uniref:GNAT family N-acetyltransferase n=1 Tax=Sporolactobacillus shoreicorticis TaxID=1923877 RepID=A0ABW5S4Y7_9BACL|nr:GNAT family N-acetyltransferase [Sporolactobacillus shoreicorticis]MCO7124376.1 GNAT family N-acetyltransferase [Sporolactobacillus shoreicorticis]